MNTIPATMQAWVAKASDQPISFETIEVPEPASHEVLVRVVAAGISPMLLKMLSTGRIGHLPTVLGHEVSGEVVRVGDEIDTQLLGRRVRVHPMISCRNCEYCMNDGEQMCAQSAMIGAGAQGRASNKIYEQYHDGGLAEFIRVPHWLIDELPDQVSHEVACKLHDFANAYRALEQASLPNGSTLVITAATGAMATASLKLAPHFGVAHVILVARSSERLAAVEALGGPLRIDSIAIEDLAEDWEETGELTQAIRQFSPDGPHAVLDYLAAGDGGAQSMQALRMGGSFVHMGGLPGPIGVPMRVIMVNLWKIIGTRACTRSDVRAVLRLLEAGALQVDGLITHRWPLAEADNAFQALITRSEPIWMGIVTNDEQPLSMSY